MSKLSGQHQELDALIERWCENLLSAEDALRLEQVVLADPAALQRYLTYVALHGTLHWDTAAGAGAVDHHASDTSAPVSRRSVETSSRFQAMPGRSRRWVAALSVCGLALAAIAGLMLRQHLPLMSPAAPQAENLANDGDPQENASLTRDDASSIDPTPVVRLDRPGSSSSPEMRPSSQDEASANTTIARSNESPRLDMVSFIDDEIAAAWQENEVEPSPPADDAEWLRRVSLDLTGRIPDLPTVTTFLADESPRKRTVLIDRLLQGEEYAHHFTTIWANLLVGRSADKSDERRGLERFLVHRFQRNLPWNETVAELVDAEGTIEENGATGFLLAHLNNEAVPATAITTRLFLCQQVQCTQCHKHPWNDWTQEQFWELNSFFQQAGIERGKVVDEATGQTRTVRALVDREVGGPTYFEDLRGIMQVAYPKFEGESVDPGQEVNRREQLARLLSGEDHLQLARAMVNRMWAHFFGFAFTNPIDDMGPHQNPTHPALLDRLSREFVASGYDVQQLIRWITSSQAYQLTSRRTAADTPDAPEAGDAPLFSRVYLKPLSPEQVYDSLYVLSTSEGGRRQDWSQLTASRQAWLQQFFEVLDNEENGELSTFDGTLPQALLMMNGELVRQAARTDDATVFEQIAVSRASDADKIRQLCLATLSREPTERELNTFRRHLQQSRSRGGDPQSAATEALRDVFWAYLNSSEFAVNH